MIYCQYMFHDLQYNIIITPDHRTGTNEPCFSVLCPVLGLADDGDTIEEAIENIKKLIAFHVESLATEGEEIKSEMAEESLVTAVKVRVPA